jgi:hypothetical protein
VELVGIEPTTSSLRTITSPAGRFFGFKHLQAIVPQITANYWDVNGTFAELSVFCLTQTLTKRRAFDGLNDRHF